MRIWTIALTISMALALGGCLKGDKGDRGEKGEKGDAGIAGVKGDKGDRGELGLAGAPGAAGARGEKGDKGDKGERGDASASGAAGAAGTALRIVRSQNAAAQCEGGEVLVSAYCIGGSGPATTENGAQCGADASSTSVRAVVVCTKQ